MGGRGADSKLATRETGRKSKEIWIRETPALSSGNITFHSGNVGSAADVLREVAINRIYARVANNKVVEIAYVDNSNKQGRLVEVDGNNANGAKGISGQKEATTAKDRRIVREVLEAWNKKHHGA